MPLDTRLPLYKFQTDPIQFKADVITPFIQAQQLRSSKLSNEATLKDLADKEKIKKILSTSVNPDGSYDFQSASQRLANAGFLNESESVRKYGVQLVRDKGLEEFNKKLNEGVEETTTEPVRNPNFSNLNENPYIAKPGEINKPGEKVSSFFNKGDLYSSWLNLTNQPKSISSTESNLNENPYIARPKTEEQVKPPEPEFLEPITKKSIRSYTYPEAVNLYIKTVPFSSEKEATDALELLRQRQGLKQSESERKEEELDLIWDKVFSIPENAKVLQVANDYALKGDMSTARNTLIGSLNKVDGLSGSQKGALIDRILKNYPLAPETPEQAAAKAFAAYNALRGDKRQDEINKELREKSIADQKDLKQRAEDYGKSVSQTINSDYNINQIISLLDKGVYSKLATIDESKWIWPMRLGKQLAQNSNLSPWKLSPEETELKNNLIALKNNLLKERSGGAVTDPEELRLINEFATNPLNTKEEFESAMRTIKQISEFRSKNRIGAYGQDAADLYNNRLKSSSEKSVPGSPTPPKQKEKEIIRVWNPKTRRVE